MVHPGRERGCPSRKDSGGMKEDITNRFLNKKDVLGVVEKDALNKCLNIIHMYYCHSEAFRGVWG